jgi:hypothetical protein
MGHSGRQGSRQGQPPSKEQLFSEFDRNNDGKLSKEEFPGPDDHFTQLDQNSDGYLPDPDFASPHSVEVVIGIHSVSTAGDGREVERDPFMASGLIGINFHARTRTTKHETYFYIEML